jgi:hypothetical protein
MGAGARQGMGFDMGPGNNPFSSGYHPPQQLPGFGGAGALPGNGQMQGQQFISGFQNAPVPMPQGGQQTQGQQFISGLTGGMGALPGNGQMPQTLPAQMPQGGQQTGQQFISGLTGGMGALPGNGQMQPQQPPGLLWAKLGQQPPGTFGQAMPQGGQASLGGAVPGGQYNQFASSLFDGAGALPGNGQMQPLPAQMPQMQPLPAQQGLGSLQSVL